MSGPFLHGNILPPGGFGHIIAGMCYPPEVTKSLFFTGNRKFCAVCPWPAVTARPQTLAQLRFPEILPQVNLAVWEKPHALGLEHPSLFAGTAKRKAGR